MRQALLAAVAAAFLVTAAPAGSTRPLTIAFSFHGYANNVKVVAPLVGPYQLGVARIRGSGTLGGGASGTAIDFGTPLYPRYKPASMRAEVIGYLRLHRHGPLGRGEVPGFRAGLDERRRRGPDETHVRRSP